MKFLIKIKPGTIKPNPDVGRDTYPVPGRSCTEVERYIRRGNDVVFQSLTDGYLNFERNRHEVCPDLPELPHDQYVSLMKGEISEAIVKHSATREHTTVHTMTPEGPHLFEYEDTPVECDNCHEKFSYKELEADAMQDGDGEETWSNWICPKCGEWDCCELEFESVESVLKKETA